MANWNTIQSVTNGGTCSLPNPNYVKGRKAEYAEVKKLRKLGYQFAGRTAGSHGIFDVYGIKIYPGEVEGFRGEIVFVQVKSGKSAERERAKTNIGILKGTFLVEGVTA